MTFTHNVTVNGVTYKTAQPSGVSPEASSYIYNLENYDPDAVCPWTNQYTFSVREDTFSGFMKYGMAVGIMVPKAMAEGTDFYGTFTAALSDGRTIGWNCCKAQYSSDTSWNHYYDFDWDDLDSQLNGAEVTALNVNIPYTVNLPRALNVTGDSSDSSLVLEPAESDSAWNLLYDSGAAGEIGAANADDGWNVYRHADLAKTSLPLSGGSLTAYAAAGGRIRIKETNELRRITDVRVTTLTGDAVDCVERESDDSYIIQVPYGDVNISVTTEELPVRHLTVTATSSDYSMTGVTVMDSLEYGKAYTSSAKNLRYREQSCTTAYASGKGGAVRSGETAEFENYYRNYRFDWWVSLVAYTDNNPPGTGNAEMADGANACMVIDHIHFFDDSGNDITGSVTYRIGGKNNMPYVQFRPQDRDMHVSFDVSLSPDYHKVYMHLTRPSRDDTIYSQEFAGKTSATKIIIPGSAAKNTVMKNSITNSANSNDVQPYLFATTASTEYTTLLGYCKENELYTYSTVRFAVYHNDENGSFTTNRITGNNSQAILNGSRGLSSDENAPYNGQAYQSSVPFSKMSGTSAPMTGKITLKLKESHVEQYRVLRHTDLSFDVTPDTNDRISFVKVYNSKDPSVTYPYTVTSESGTTRHYTVEKRTDMTGEIAIEVYFRDETSLGELKIYNKDIYGNPITLTGTGARAELSVTNVEWFEPRGTVNSQYYGHYSTDGSQSRKYYYDNYASMGVRPGSTPSFMILPEYNTSTKTHYRIGMVLYGDTMSTQDQNRIRIASPPLANDQTVRLDFTKPVDGNRYITIVYVKFADDEATIPKVYTPYPTETGNSTLAVNLFLLDDDTNEYNLINDSNAGELNNLKVTLTASQKCIGYAVKNAEGSNVSNRDHHAYYDEEGQPTEIYTHDTNPTVMIYDYAAQQFDSLIGPLAGDGDYATGSRNISAGVSHRMNTGSSLFALKYNNVDVIDAILTTDIGEEYLLQKMVISDSTSGSVETKEFTGAQSISSTYRYQTDDHNRTINYYFRRVVMELGTNHQQGVEKGSVSYIVGDGEAVAIQATDHNQACKISVGKPVTLKIKPSEGYRLFGVWVGESIDSQQPVTDVSGPDENGELSVNLGKWYKTVYVNVRFAPVNTTGISQLVIRQYMVDSENNVTPITEGKVVAKGTGTQDKPFVTGDEVTLQGAQSLETDVYEDTSVIFMLTPPPNGDVKELKASMQGASDSERIPLGLTNTEGNTFTLNESTQKDKMIYVDAYFTATYSLFYDANEGIGQVPLAQTGKKTGDKVTLDTQNHSLSLDGFSFKGWSLFKDNDESKVIDEVTFENADITVYAVWKADHYTVTYRKGSDSDTKVTGEPPTDETLYSYHQEVTVKGNHTLARENDVFLGWNEIPDASEVQYAANEKFNIRNDTVLYPVWATVIPDESVRIKYSSGVDPAQADDPSLMNERVDTFTVGGDYTVRPNDGWTDFKRSGYRFVGWNVASVDTIQPAPTATPRSGGGTLSDYWQKHKFWNPNDVIPSLTDSISLTAVWERIYKVTYDGNGNTGGTAPTDYHQYSDNDAVTVEGRNTLEKTGCTFRGWNTEKDGSGTHYDIGANLVIHGSNVILYTEWVEGSGRNVGSPGTGESDSDTRMAFISMLMSAITLTASGLWLLRKYRLEKA